MKIAIITLPLHTNYGGILQAYALQTVLQRMGHQVEHLQPKIENIKLHPTWILPLVWIKRILKYSITGDWKIPIFEHPQLWIRKNTDKFIQKHINTRILLNKQWNEYLGNQYDAFIVGSDQVWRSAYTRTIDRYFLSFLGATSTKLRITYAASFGLDRCDFTSEELKTCIPLLQKFHQVSVREDSGINICKQLFKKEALQVLDPTLLLQKADYIKLIRNTKPSKGNLLVYVLDPSSHTDDFVQSTAKKMNLTPFSVNGKSENGKIKISERQQPPLEEWIRGFEDAEFVITDSFHGCIFSIIFNKPFVCLNNSGRGAERFNSLFRQFGLQDCMISQKNPFENNNIKWKEVNEQWQKAQQWSISYLEQNLKIQD